MLPNDSYKRFTFFILFMSFVLALAYAAALVGTGHDVPLWLVAIGANAAAAVVTIATREK